MRNYKFHRPLHLFILLGIGITPSLSFAHIEKKVDSKTINPNVAPQFFEKAKSNPNWKFAFATGKHGQVVFMNVSPNTNPKNEIGLETHLFDQIILIAQGEGKAVLNGKTSNVKAGDMIFIPQGTSHNVINVNKNKPLKIVSFYSDNDIPSNSIYKTKADEH